MYWYTVWILNPNTKANIDFYSPKLDLKTGDYIEIDGKIAGEFTPGFESSTIYEFVIVKVVWRSVSQEEKPPYHVAELLVAYLTELG